MRVASLIAVGLIGCNAFGIDETFSTALDADHDGVLDTEDNCPESPNADQADADADGVGDECDFNELQCEVGIANGLDTDADGIDDGCDDCVGTQNDEDGDGLSDSCDNCPADPNPDQANDDADVAGAICDLSNISQQRRVIFDGFGEATLSSAWQPTAGWRTDGGALVGTAPNALALTTPAELLGGVDKSWYVRVGVSLPAGAALDQEIAIEMSNANGRCRCGFLSQGNNTWIVYGQEIGNVLMNEARGDESLTSGTDVALRMSYRTPPQMFESASFDCEAIGRDLVNVTPGGSDQPLVAGIVDPTLVTDVEVRFTHVDILR